MEKLRNYLLENNLVELYELVLSFMRNPSNRTGDKVLAACPEHIQEMAALEMDSIKALYQSDRREYDQQYTYGQVIIWELVLTAYKRLSEQKTIINQLKTPQERKSFIHSENELRNKSSATLADLAGRDYVFLRYSDAGYEFPLEICKALAVPMNTVSYVDSRSMHREMIASGIAVGFIPESVMDIYKNDTKIKTLILMNKKFSRQMMICFKREKHLSETANEFRRFTMDYFDIPAQQ